MRRMQGAAKEIERDVPIQDANEATCRACEHFHDGCTLVFCVFQYAYLNNRDCTPKCRETCRRLRKTEATWKHPLAHCIKGKW